LLGIAHPIPRRRSVLDLKRPDTYLMTVSNAA